MGSFQMTVLWLIMITMGVDPLNSTRLAVSPTCLYAKANNALIDVRLILISNRSLKKKQKYWTSPLNFVSQQYPLSWVWHGVMIKRNHDVVHVQTMTSAIHTYNVKYNATDNGTNTILKHGLRVFYFFLLLSLWHTHTQGVSHTHFCFSTL